MVAGMLQRYLEGRGHRVERCSNGRDALRTLRDFAFDVALLDIEMPELDGLEVLRQAREDPFPPECIIITGHSTIDTAVSAMRFGAYDYLAKPYRLEEIDILVRRAAEKRRMSFDNVRMRRRLFRLEAPQAPQSDAPSMLAALQAAERAAASLASVLIVGEPGTGKSTIARYLHHVSPRADGPLVVVNCDLTDPRRAMAALFSTTAEATVDDAEEAPPRIVGALEEAAGGTVVFADVEWLDDATQAALAEALASGYYRRQQARARVAVESRSIATTITAMGDLHEIRTDLLQQLSGEVIALPPLRAREADILPIARRYVHELSPRSTRQLTDAAASALMAYHWPGNLRELRAVMSRAVAVAPEDRIDVQHLFLPTHVEVDGAVPDDSLEAMERRHILAVLAAVGGHQGKAAERLGISSKTLYRKIREYGVPRDLSPGSE